MRHLNPSTLALLATAAAASAEVNPIFVAPADSHQNILAFAISPTTGDITFDVAPGGTTTQNYYVKKHLGNVKYNEFTVPIDPGTTTSPNIGPDGLLSLLNSSPTSLTLTRISFDGDITNAPLTTSGSPIDPSSFQPLPTGGSNKGATQITTRQSPHSSIIISTRLDGSHLGETTPLDSFDGTLIGLSSHNHDLAYSYTPTAGTTPVIKVLADDGSKSSTYQFPQFSSIGTPVIAGDSLLFVSTTDGIDGPVTAIQSSPLYDARGREAISPLYGHPSSNFTIDTPAVNDADGLAFLLTETDDLTHLPAKHIVHRDLAARSFLTDLSTGDPLLGSTITDLYLSPDSLANDGSLLFYATLADGTSGLFLTSVPEPTSLLACGFAILPLTRRRR